MNVNCDTKKRFYTFSAKKINKNFNYSLFFLFFCAKIIKQVPKSLFFFLLGRAASRTRTIAPEVRFGAPPLASGYPLHHLRCALRACSVVPLLSLSHKTQKKEAPFLQIVLLYNNIRLVKRDTF
jgi:hypothetical protein